MTSEAFIIQELSKDYKDNGLCCGEVKVSKKNIKVDLPRRAYISKCGRMSISSQGYSRRLWKADKNKSYYVSER